MFEVGKTYKTRDGRDARVICVDRADEVRPIVALVMDVDGNEGLYTFRESGKYGLGRAHVDLMPPMITKYVNVYPGEGSLSGTHDTGWKAKEKAGANAIAIAVPINYYEGQGKEEE